MLFCEKIPFHIAARLTVRLWVPHLLRFATIRHYSRLFTIICTIRDYSHYSYYSLLGTLRCSLFATICYSLFGFSRHPDLITVSAACPGQQTILVCFSRELLNLLHSVWCPECWKCTSELPDFKIFWGGEEHAPRPP